MRPAVLLLAFAWVSGTDCGGLLSGAARAPGRTASADPRGVSLNVVDFGAKGDGSSDDTAAIRVAIAAAAGRELRFPAGTYLTGTITVPSDTRIVGAGMRATTIRLRNFANQDLLTSAPGGGVGAVIDSLTLDGNCGQNTFGRGLYWLTDDSRDGPSLTLRDVAITAAAGDADGNSAVVTGLNWVQWDNVRFIDNPGGLEIAVQDSTFVSLYLGNSGVVRSVPGLKLAGGNNRFVAAYFGGNGQSTAIATTQVSLEGASGNFFIDCVNDSANGHAYEFSDYLTNSSSHNSIIGGYITNPSQARDNTYSHVLVRGTASENRIIGVRFDNSKHNKGFAFYQNVGTGVGNQMLGNSYGAVGTAVLAAPVPGDLATALTGPLRPATPAGYMQSGALYQGTGIPRDTDGSDGDVYFRTDTPGVATQRMYVKSGGNWVGIL